jgi:hypothetical protein
MLRRLVITEQALDRFAERHLVLEGLSADESRGGTCP